MALSPTVFHFTDASIKFIDNTPSTPLELDIVHCTGDFAESGGNAIGGGNRALSTYQTRGGENAEFGTTVTRAGAHEPSSISFTLQMFDYTEATVGTIRDWEYRLATFAAAIGFEDSGEAFSFKIVVTYNRPNSEDDQTMTYTRCIITNGDYSEGEPNTASMSITCLGTAVAATVP